MELASVVTGVSLRLNFKYCAGLGYGGIGLSFVE